VTDEKDPHYTPENTADGIHVCPDVTCMTQGVPVADLSQIGFSLGVLLPLLDGTGIRTATFRTGTGLYVLLTVPYETHHAVIGAIYTPQLMADLRERGYTLSHAEAEGGVN
jgi:hypothetical protein